MRCRILGKAAVSLKRSGMDPMRALVAAGGVSAVLLAQDPDRLVREPAYLSYLRLKALIEEERQAARENSYKEAEVWARKLSDLDIKRSAYQDQQSEGIITFNELRSKLASLVEVRSVALKALEALRSRRQRMEPLEHNAHPLLELYAGMVSEILDNFTSKEYRSTYKMLQPRVMVSADGPLEITDVFGRPLEACALRSVKTEGMSLRIPEVHRTPQLGFRAQLIENAAWWVEVVRAR